MKCRLRPPSHRAACRRRLLVTLASAAAPRLAVHRNRRTAQAIEEDDEAAALPLIPAGAEAEVETLAFAGPRRARIVRLVVEHQRVATTEMAAGVEAGFNPRAQAIGERVGP